MKFNAGMKCVSVPDRGDKPLLCLEAVNGTLKFEVPDGSGAFNHLTSEQLKGLGWPAAREDALMHYGSLQPIQTIELDEDDLAHLARFRVN